MLEYLEKYSTPGTTAEAVIIWLHGLGADYNDFAALVPELKLSRCVKFVFPNAPLRPISVNNGYVMRGWYDIYDLTQVTPENTDNAGIKASIVAIEELIKHEINLGFSAQQIILAGFSQGGVIAYTVGLSGRYSLAGIIALSCYLPNADVLIASTQLPTTVPIFAAHGQLDQVVPYSAGLLAYQKLYAAKFAIDWHSYQMAHSVCPTEIADLAKWVDRVFCHA